MSYKPKEIVPGQLVTPRCHLCKRDPETCGKTIAHEELRTNVWPAGPVTESWVGKTVYLEPNIYGIVKCLIPVEMTDRGV